MKLSHSYLKLSVYNTYNFNGSNNCCNVHSKVATGTCVASHVFLCYLSVCEEHSHRSRSRHMQLPGMHLEFLHWANLAVTSASYSACVILNVEYKCSWMTQLVTQPSFLQILPCKNCLVLYSHSNSVSYSWEPSEGNEVNYCNTMQYTVVLRNLGFVENFVPWPVTNVNQHWL